MSTEVQPPASGFSSNLIYFKNSHHCMLQCSLVFIIRKLHLLSNLLVLGCIAYNLGTGCGTSVLEMVTAFEKASGKVTVPSLHLSSLLSKNEASQKVFTMILFSENPRQVVSTKAWRCHSGICFYRESWERTWLEVCSQPTIFLIFWHITRIFSFNLWWCFRDTYPPLHA